ncbi:FecR domain-containing protein [Mucilaginibacter sp. UR6-1]|uniref:FecR family protein n=1 Tax=Mucilaginibacter sp. UR6-1 TaxID=1435643 RepID=UPI001E3C031C|nr:FecR domain-containing protein [Mucilaginibacter sp. UR6-1]MCC8409302.1 FecR domain-containing protein [Mucilaginibacter sp. UR6-1]
MRRFNKPNEPGRVNDGRLQEKLVEKYFQNLDFDDVQTGPHDAEFDSKGVYANILNAIDAVPETPKRRSYTGWMVAASVLIAFISLTYYFRYNILNYVSPVHTMQVAAARGSVTSIVLGDGTKVWLNGGSRISYPETFRGEKREVTITGEAFFDVMHKTDQPFIVHTGNITTHVLGTSFNIKAYDDDQLLHVDVVSGKVGVVPAEGSALSFNTIYLTPAQGITYNKTDNSISKTAGIDISALSDWKAGKLIFKNAALPEVIKTLNREFEVSIRADANLTACNISADFTNVPIKDIMAVIARLVKGKATLNGTVYHLKGKGC